MSGSRGDPAGEVPCHTKGCWGRSGWQGRSGPQPGSRRPRGIFLSAARTFNIRQVLLSPGWCRPPVFWRSFAPGSKDPGNYSLSPVENALGRGSQLMVVGRECLLGIKPLKSNHWKVGRELSGSMRGMPFPSHDYSKNQTDMAHCTIQNGSFLQKLNNEEVRWFWWWRSSSISQELLQMNWKWANNITDTLNCFSRQRFPRMGHKIWESSYQSGISPG